MCLFVMWLKQKQKCRCTELKRKGRGRSKRKRKVLKMKLFIDKYQRMQFSCMTTWINMTVSSFQSGKSFQENTHGSNFTEKTQPAHRLVLANLLENHIFGAHLGSDWRRLVRGAWQKEGNNLTDKACDITATSKNSECLKTNSTFSPPFCLIPDLLNKIRKSQVDGELKICKTFSCQPNIVFVLHVWATNTPQLYLSLKKASFHKNRQWETFSLIENRSSQ